MKAKQEWTESEAILTIERVGGKVAENKDGVIRIPRSIRLDKPENAELCDAIVYLVVEWDYDHGEPLDIL